MGKKSKNKEREEDSFTKQIEKELKELRDSDDNLSADDQRKLDELIDNLKKSDYFVSKLGKRKLKYVFIKSFKTFLITLFVYLGMAGLCNSGIDGHIWPMFIYVFILSLYDLLSKSLINKMLFRFPHPFLLLFSYLTFTFMGMYLINYYVSYFKFINAEWLLLFFFGGQLIILLIKIRLFRRLFVK